MTRLLLAAALALVACKGDERPAAPSPAAPEADSDPVYTHVDRDQLAALCLAARLPQTSIPSEYGALALADDTRVPWLAISSLQEFVEAGGQPFVGKDAWLAGAREHAAFVARVNEGNRLDDRPPTGREWKNVPCEGDEVSAVVVTAVFVARDGAHVVAMRGTKILEKSVPLDAGDEAIFRAAFALTEELLGQDARIATHKLGPADQLPTVTTPIWAKAAAD